jgi:hypothetical protein
LFFLNFTLGRWHYIRLYLVHDFNIIFLQSIREWIFHIFHIFRIFLDIHLISHPSIPTIFSSGDSGVRKIDSMGFDLVRQNGAHFGLRPLSRNGSWTSRPCFRCIQPFLWRGQPGGTIAVPWFKAWVASLKRCLTQRYGRSMCVAVNQNPRDLCLHTHFCSFRQRHIHVYIMYECIYIYVICIYIIYIYILCIWYIQRHVSGSEPRNRENACVQH